MDEKAKLNKGSPCRQGAGLPIGQQLTSIVALTTPDQLYEDFGGGGGEGKPWCRHQDFLKPLR